MSTAVRWGLLGTARINRRLIPAMRSARRSQVVAVASRDTDRAHAYAREWNVPVAHGTYDALLRDHSVDAVYIPVPNALHVEWTLRALDAGKHVLCEKPLALTPEDVDRIDAVARAQQRVATEAFMFRHEPIVPRVLELTAKGAVGPLRRISAGFTFAQDRTPDVRLDPALGGGSLWDVGCYAVNAVRVIAGAEPVSVCGMATMSDRRVDESFSGLLQFSNGVIASIHSSFRAAYSMWLEVAGADGTLRVVNPFKPSLREPIEIRRGDEVQTVVVEGSSALFVRQIEDFVAAALDGRPAAVSLRDSRGNAATLAALHASALSGTVVRL